VPAGRGDAVVIEGGGPTTVIESGLDDDWSSLSVTCTVKVKVPAAVGVPPRNPFVDSANPAGNGADPDANDQEYGVLPPVAASVTAYDIFTVPFGNETVVIESGELMTSVKFLSLLCGEDAESLNVTLT
jgi:hypothetical protein